MPDSSLRTTAPKMVREVELEALEPNRLPCTCALCCKQDSADPIPLQVEQTLSDLSRLYS
jgi:hypothetical protein